ncbi:MAG: hypothetical protein HZC19_00035 [Candidatus Omnitrophica bacterium]|nr:hypothetical protein [Candidatus Omnitrophota bacterium]
MKTLFKSIRFKITILYVAILALTLTLFSTILYHNVSAGLYNNMDTLLKSKAGGVAQAINTYWQTANLEVTEAGLKPEALIKRRNTNFAKVAQRWVKEESNDPRLLDILVQVFDTDGNIIASSKNAQGLTEISRKNFITVLQGKSRFDTVSSQVQSNRIHTFAHNIAGHRRDGCIFGKDDASPSGQHDKDHTPDHGREYGT